MYSRNIKEISFQVCLISIIWTYFANVAKKVFSKGSKCLSVHMCIHKCLEACTSVFVKNRHLSSPEVLKSFIFWKR